MPNPVMYNAVTPVGSSRPILGKSQPSTRKEVSWLSELKGKTIAQKGDGLFFSRPSEDQCLVK